MVDIEGFATVLAESEGAQGQCAHLIAKQRSVSSARTVQRQHSVPARTTTHVGWLMQLRLRQRGCRLWR